MSCGREVLDPLDVLDGLVDRHGADRHRAGRDDRPADGVDVAAGREVHDRVGAELDGHPELGQLVVDVGGHGRVADVRVDLALRLDADGHRLEAQPRCTVLAGMIIRPRATSERTSSGVEPLAPGDERHLVGDDPLSGHFDLRHDASHPREPIDAARRADRAAARTRGRRPRIAPIRYNISPGDFVSRWRQARGRARGVGRAARRPAMPARGAAASPLRTERLAQPSRGAPRQDFRRPPIEPPRRPGTI